MDLLKHTLGDKLLAVYLYGSATLAGLQKYSDIDLFVVVKKSTTSKQKKALLDGLLPLSGLYKKGRARPIELTLVIKSDVNPWRYPPKFDFQYGEWLRKDFERGVLEPWQDKFMAELAILMTQVMLSHEILYQQTHEVLFCDVPYSDFIAATQLILDELKGSVDTDTRNVLLTLSRIWYTLEANEISSKHESAMWVLDHLPCEYHPALIKAINISMGKNVEDWEGVKPHILPCTEYMLNHINKKIDCIKKSNVIHENILRVKNP